MIIFTGGEYIEADAPVIFGGPAINGVFDTLLAVNGAVMDADLHYARLLHDVDSVMGYPQSVIPALPALEDIWRELLKRNGLENSTARVRTLVADHKIFVSAEHAPPAHTLPPLKCTIIRDYPRIAGDKRENSKRADYTRSYAAREAAKTLGADDAILTNTGGNIACGTTSNIFIEENGVLITPPLSDGVLAGITRAKLKAREESISEERLRKADAVYLTNSIFGKRKISVI